MTLLRRIAVPILIAVASLGSAPAGEPSLATARSLLDAGKTDAAGAELLRLTKRRTDAENNYLLARVLMRTGDREAALQQLGQAIAAGFADEPRLGAEPDFAPLLEEKNFGVLRRVAKAEADRRKAYDAEEIPGLRTMRSPPGSPMPWRLRLPADADSRNRARVLAWLHPSGTSANPAAEALAKPLAEAGWSLLVFTRKDWGGWQPQEVKHLLDALHRVSLLPECDGGRPALWGFSAGGQVALQLHRTQPDAWSALVIGSAYPVGSRDDGFPLLDPPTAKGLEATPLFVSVGDKDGLVDRWRTAEPAWRKAGVPLTVHYLPGLKHPDWPFTGAFAQKMVEFLMSVPRRTDEPGGGAH